MPDLPEHPSLEHLRKQAKRRKRDRAIPLSQAQHEVAREYGFDSWPKLVRHLRASGLEGIERALTLADVAALSLLLQADRTAAAKDIEGLAPLLVLLRRSTGMPADVCSCARLLLDAGASPNSHTIEWGGEGQRSALFDAVERGDLEIVRLLLERGATRDEDAFYHACEQSNTTFLDLLQAPGFESMVNHKLDFEDAAGLQWFLERDVDVNANRCLHHAISRGRGLRVITMLLDAGADVNLPWDRWDVGRRPLALAARCGHLAAYELLASRGATAHLDPVDAAVLAVARGESVRLPHAAPPSLGNPSTDDYGWILGQFALLGRTDVVRALLDTGMSVDTRGWSNFTPLEQAAMHGRTETVRLLIRRGADLHDRAFDAEGPTPLDGALWGLQNNRAEDGDYAGTVEALLAAGAPTRHSTPTGDDRVDALLAKYAAPQ
ncbi:MAG: ankyrin repeat domain-containing protein [Candidatus Dormibacteraeota bacterium]|nr:ankyrin repeat domain-containing protein [Candidatus Dormibacteraeota bacterium]